MIRTRPIFILLSLWLLALGSGQAAAQTANLIDLEEIRQSTARINTQLDNKNLSSTQDFDQALGEIGANRSKLLQCISNREQELSALRRSLGTEYIKEIESKEKRSQEENKLTQQIAALTSRISDCKLLMEQSNSLQVEIESTQIALAREDLNQRRGHIVSNVRTGLISLPGLIGQRLETALRVSGPERDQVRLSAIILVALGGMLGGIVVNRRARLTWGSTVKSVSLRILFTTWFVMRKWAPVFMPVITVSAYLWFTERHLFGQYRINQLVLLLVAYTLSLIFIRSSIRWYRIHVLKAHGREIPSRLFFLRLTIASTASALWLMLIAIPGDIDFNQASSVLLHNILTVFVVATHFDLIYFLPRVVTMSRTAHLVRLLAMLMLGLGMILELLGYLNMSTFIWGGVLASGISIFIFFFLSNLSSDFYDSIDQGTFQWEQRFRSALSIKAEEPVPGLLWIRLMTIGVLWVGLMLLLMKSWGFSNTRIGSVFSFLRDGIKLGDSLIVLSDVVVGILLFSLLLMLIRWSKDSLDKKYLMHSKMDSGAREAIVTISGYIGFVIAALVGLTVAGVEMSNLAIIAGALSLGIGFGLQNIVNNFVSGIILLFERPIRAGDWIVTGTTEGYVRKISVRSTEVQTFDRSDVIVPNSQLISAEVTNLTLRDDFGRVIVPVGVAYGSDTTLVKEVLEDIARQFPKIVQDRPMLPTKVIFRGFGDSTLDFELRCFIYDIGGILDIKSDLNFAIDKAFREHGIEIAFPQRDIHIRSTVESGSSKEPLNKS